jgi:1,4-dihydroxy-2-naphthoate octaprenyltransferase
MNPYIQSLRPRTLPLSVSGIILGTGLAYAANNELFTTNGSQAWCVFILAVLTTLSLQILSNLCNELGDAQKGTDFDQKGRAEYGLQSGKITELQIKKMIGYFKGMSVIFGTTLVFTAFHPHALSWDEGWRDVFIFLCLGALAIVGAIKYTLGKHSYGYMGLGDLGVFLFFGLLSTMGAYYLQVQNLTAEAAWCGVAIGLPCVGVLNLNNIRDMQNDIRHGKKTFAGLLGPRGARVYHTLLLIGAVSIFTALGHWWVLCILPVLIYHLWFLWTHDDKLDKQMPILMFTTLLMAILALFC